ncbi:hypothetical protein OPT61_g9020 [Boeremia exigua]|uniref:Uncharacterized protein n=1 Tax=Boeremia exigua TaxID=749465 RepID=A0ACC2HWN1_9PLEO|nr:hypothetical protein OPT61_g9020 [Boeremia exigua]
MARKQSGALTTQTSSGVTPNPAPRAKKSAVQRKPTDRRARQGWTSGPIAAYKDAWWGAEEVHDRRPRINFVRAIAIPIAIASLVSRATAMPELVGKQVGPVGFGLMGMTWRPTPPPQAQSFEAMRTALSLGANNWNGGELYGPPDANSLQLLAAYFDKYPEDAEKVVLSIKGGTLPGQLTPDGSRKNVRRSVDECLKWLGGKKTLDLFECMAARCVV